MGSRDFASGEGLPFRITHVPTAASAMSARTMSAGRDQVFGGTTPWSGERSIASRAARTSPARRYRRSGSFSRHRETTVFNPAGTFGGNGRGGGRADALHGSKKY